MSPRTVVQTCVVHLIRNAMSAASCSGGKPIAQALRSVYRADVEHSGRRTP